jgi:hypothetical protein
LTAMAIFTISTKIVFAYGTLPLLASIIPGIEILLCLCYFNHKI